MIGGGGGVGRGGGVGGGDALRTEAGDEGAAPVVAGDIAAQVDRADVASADAEPQPGRAAGRAGGQGRGRQGWR